MAKTFHPYRTSIHPKVSSKFHKILCWLGFHNWETRWTVVLVLDGSVAMPDGQDCLCCAMHKADRRHEVNDYTACRCRGCLRELITHKDNPMATPWKKLRVWSPGGGPVKAVAISKDVLDKFIKESESQIPSKE